MTSPEQSWVEQGSPLDALQTMLDKPDVLIEEFHAVYQRLLETPYLLEVPGIRALMEELLSSNGAWEDALFQEWKMPTSSARERFDDAPEVGDCTPIELANWIIENRTILDRANGAERLLDLGIYSEIQGGRSLNII